MSYLSVSYHQFIKKKNLVIIRILSLSRHFFLYFSITWHRFCYYKVLKWSSISKLFEENLALNGLFQCTVSKTLSIRDENIIINRKWISLKDKKFSFSSHTDTISCRFAYASIFFSKFLKKRKWHKIKIIDSIFSNI